LRQDPQGSASSQGDPLWNAHLPRGLELMVATFSRRQASLIFYLRFICLMTAIPFAIFYLAHRLLRLGQFLRPKRVRPQVSRRPSKILPRYGIFRIRIKKRTLPRFPPSLFIYVIILCSITYLNIFITRALPPLTTHTRTLLFSL